MLLPRYLVLASFVIGSMGPVAWSQGTRADYERAANSFAKVQDKLFRHQVQPHWNAKGDSFWYRVRTGPTRHEFIVVDAQRGERRPAFDATRLAASLQKTSGKGCDANALPFTRIELNDTNQQLTFTALDHVWSCDLANYELTQLPNVAAAESTVARLAQPRRSRNLGGDTSIRFVHRWTEPLQLFWLDRGAQRIPYGTLDVGATREQHTFAGHVWVLVDGQGQTRGIFQAVAAPGDAIVDGTVVPADLFPDAQATPEDANSPAPPGDMSPDGHWRAFIEQHNVWLEDQTQPTHPRVPLTTDGREADAYRPPLVWSPNSQHLVAIQETKGQGRVVRLIESTPRDQLQPKLREIPYDKPGDDIPQPRLRLFNVAAQRQTVIEPNLCEHPWSISDIRWNSESSRFSFLFNQRGHQRARIVAVNPLDGHAQVLVDESSPTFVDYAHKQFVHYDDAHHQLIWMSERSGWNHLYQFDADTGALRHPITQGEWLVRDVVHVDDDAQTIWFYAGGIIPELDPYFRIFCRVQFDGSNLRVLTPGPGTHDVEFSPDRRWLIDHYSRVDLPPVTELRDASDGRLVCTLEQADAQSLFASGWRSPEPFVAMARDGKTPIYGVLHFPSNFDPQAVGRYPVIEQIYAGPQASYVPKAFASYHDAMQLAELGFVVAQIDGMGTSHRSKAFHDVCWKNLGDAGFPDRIAWMRAAAAKWPALDLSRVGIYGGSAGGQNALRGLLIHPEFYKAGAADCGCHDNRVDKIWWNELWMGWPIGPHYEEQSNVTQAHRLQGKLLLTVGEIDQNVDPASTLQVVDALIRADKDFELLIIPGADHGAGEGSYARRRRQDFFVRHLLGVEPRAN